MSSDKARKGGEKEVEAVRTVMGMFDIKYE